MKFLSNLMLAALFLVLFGGVAQMSYAVDGEAVTTGEPQVEDPKLPNSDFLKIHEKYGTEAGFQNNVADPFTNGGTWSNNNGEGTYSSSLTAKGSHNFLELFALPSGTGDIELTIKQDTDMDGSFDLSYTVPRKLSGACANGFIACDPGTWVGCDFYKWVSQPDGTLYYTEVPNSQVGGCFCFNNSCGYGLAMSNVGHIIQTLGGASVGAIQEQKPEYIITGSLVDGTLITFSGNDSSKPPEGSTIPTADKVNQEIFAKNPTSLGAMGKAKAAASGENDLFSMATNFTSTPDKTRHSCREKNYFQVESLQSSDVIAFAGGEGSVSSCGEGCLRLVLGKLGDDYVCGWRMTYDTNALFKVWYPDLIEKVTLDYAWYDDWLRFYVGDEPYWQGPNPNPAAWPPVNGWIGNELGRTWIQNPNTDITDVFRNVAKGETVKTKTSVVVGGCGEGYFKATIQLSDMLCSITPAYSNNCDSYAQKTGCRLINETVDGVQTIRNGNPTGLVPYPTTKVVEDGNCKEQKTLNWWDKERTYECEVEHYGDFTDFREKANAISDSISLDGNSMGYTDKTSGGSTSHTIEIGEVTYGESCQKMCKTQIDTSNTSILSEYQDLNTYNVNTKSTASNYYECLPEVGCPVPEGETIVKDCQCFSEFAEAAAAMMTLDQAGKDTVCTSGDAKDNPPPKDIPDSYSNPGATQ